MELNLTQLIVCLWFRQVMSQIFDAFDLKNKGAIGFGDFVRSLNVFHPKAPEAEKISCKKLTLYDCEL